MLSWSLDIRSLTVDLTSVSAILSVILYLIWRSRRTYPGFGLWTAGNALYAAGFMLIALRGMVPALLSVVLANTLLLSGTVLFLEGVRSFRGVAGSRSLSVALVAVPLLLISCFTFVADDTGMRIIVFSASTAVIAGLVAWALLRDAPPDLRFSLRFTGSLFALHALFMFFRALLTFLNPGPHDLLAPNLIQTLTFLVALLLGIAWTFGFVMLNSERLEVDLKKAQVELQRLAETDFLTGIANNRRFFEDGEREIQRARRYGHPLAALMLDLDHFKRVNDTHGHAAGDKVLVAVTATCRRLLRDIDVFGRLGGEEFVILLPETDLAGGLATAERLRLAIGEMAIVAGDRTLRITISIGVTLLSPDDAGLDAVLKRADDAMYEAKRNGRNRVAAAPQSAADGSDVPSP
jgi:diguanylate cyclase (GGDEF)-like protein